MERVVRTLGAVALIAACAAAGLWGTDYLIARTGESSASDTPSRQAVRVTVTTPEPRMVADGVSAIGTVYAQRSVDLRPLVSGRVEAVLVESGAEVDAGDPILRLDARAELAALARAEATRDETRQAYRRVLQLSEDNVAAEARLEAARAAAERAEAELEAARADLEDRQLRAPFDGTLGIVTIDPGQYVDSDTVVTSLDDLSAVEVEFALPEVHYARVEPGQSVRLTSAVYPGRTFTGSVSVRSASVDPATRSFAVRATLSNPERRLADGMFVEVEVVFDRAEALTLPDDAIVSEGASSYVFTVEDGTARRREIAVGAGPGGRTVVTDGLSADDRVVLTGWDTLSDGDTVAIVEDIPREALN